MKQFCVAIAFFLLNTPAMAQFAQAEGEYVSPLLNVRVVVLDVAKGAAAASTVVTAGSCSGSVAGIGQFKGRTMSFSPYEKVEGGEKCLITMDFDPSWKQVKVTGRNCSSYSGAACGWEGQTATKRREN